MYNIVVSSKVKNIEKELKTYCYLEFLLETQELFKKTYSVFYNFSPNFPFKVPIYNTRIFVPKNKFLVTDNINLILLKNNNYSYNSDIDLLNYEDIDDQIKSKIYNSMILKKPACVEWKPNSSLLHFHIKNSIPDSSNINTKINSVLSLSQKEKQNIYVFCNNVDFKKQISISPSISHDLFHIETF